MHVGLARLCYAFLAGMLSMRSGKRLYVRHWFGVCNVLLVLAPPRMGGTPHHWSSGLYNAACVLRLFSLVAAIGAGGQRAAGRSVRVARFLGDLSFPVYITHYPLIYPYTAWVVDRKVPARLGAPANIALIVVAVAIAYASLNLYNEPARRWLSRRFLGAAGR